MGTSDFASSALIILTVYIIAELIKFFILDNIKTKRQLHKIIPVFCAILGGICAVVYHAIDPTYLGETSTISTLLSVGFFSGLASTGMDQILKQFGLDLSISNLLEKTGKKTSNDNDDEESLDTTNI